VQKYKRFLSCHGTGTVASMGVGEGTFQRMGRKPFDPKVKISVNTPASAPYFTCKVHLCLLKFEEKFQ